MFLDPQQEKTVMDSLSTLPNPVILTVHSEQWESAKTQATLDLVNYTVSLMPQKIMRQLATTDQAQVFDPTVTISNGLGRTFGIQFVGAPSGMEYAAFIESIAAFSRLSPPDHPSWERLLHEIQRPVMAKIFVSPT
ncbi:hypothetical protein [Sulfobacillus thermosulfidooxidans]|uniref:hypothetical protein n=1 Tax=Sulfobacillus thermosulfidooxidans TaxID=28034 RepID=UPI0006B404C2|nr:hypothetical protein [Sulfobacillus thermosulfidooxidans]